MALSFPLDVSLLRHNCSIYTRHMGAYIFFARKKLQSPRNILYSLQRYAQKDKKWKLELGFFCKYHHHHYRYPLSSFLSPSFHLAPVPIVIVTLLNYQFFPAMLLHSSFYYLFLYSPRLSYFTRSPFAAAFFSFIPVLCIVCPNTIFSPLFLWFRYRLHKQIRPAFLLRSGTFGMCLVWYVRWCSWSSCSDSPTPFSGTPHLPLCTRPTKQITTYTAIRRYNSRGKPLLLLSPHFFK